MEELKDAPEVKEIEVKVEKQKVEPPVKEPPVKESPSKDYTPPPPYLAGHNSYRVKSYAGLNLVKNLSYGHFCCWACVRDPRAFLGSRTYVYFGHSAFCSYIRDPTKISRISYASVNPSQWVFN